MMSNSPQQTFNIKYTTQEKNLEINNNQDNNKNEIQNQINNQNKTKNKNQMIENELAILDFINVIMKIFDEVFKNVCELHLIMNPDKLYLIIDEMISGGIVIETNKDEIISNYLSKCKILKFYFFINNIKKLNYG